MNSRGGHSDAGYPAGALTCCHKNHRRAAAGRDNVIITPHTIYPRVVVDLQIRPRKKRVC
jgi:hypothetical protein